VIRKPEQREMAMSLYQIQATDEVVNEPCNVICCCIKYEQHVGSKMMEGDDERYTSLSNGGTAMSLYQIQATDGVNGGRVTVKGQTTSDTQA
jgi:hypothetical protein